MKKATILAFFGCIFLLSCNEQNGKSDAYGNFEAEDLTISAQIPGELLKFELEEGQTLTKGQYYGLIDTTDLYLSKLELQANINVISSQYKNLTAQINVIEAQIENINREIIRTRKLVETDAVPKKQLDDLEGSLLVAKEQIEAVRAQNPAVFSQLEVARIKLAQVEDKISRAHLKSPSNGLVLNKIANTHQMLSPGSPLFTMADLSIMTFRAYVSGIQLSQINLGDELTVLVDDHKQGLKAYKAKLSWISNESEFTPKIIQTREERVDMVYAVKLLVVNDGSLKIGMPGELVFDYVENQ